MVRALFIVSKVHAPAVVFIDEIDSLLSQRSDGEHESSRRIKTEFLVQLVGERHRSQTISDILLDVEFEFEFFPPHLVERCSFLNSTPEVRFLFGSHLVVGNLKSMNLD